MCKYGGLLASIKIHMQVEICKLVGKGAKKAGGKKNWRQRQALYWKGISYKRSSKEYQELLDAAFLALSRNTSFRKSLLSTGEAMLTHNM